MLEDLRNRRKLRDLPLFRLFVMGGLCLVLLIPLAMVGSLIREREARRGQATGELSQTWGGPQTLSGPVLFVPYRQWVRDEHGKVEVVTQEARFLPETLRTEGRIDPERRSRGIFEAVLYRAGLKVSGTFKRPSLAAWHVAPEDILWNDARLSFGLSDMRGLHRAGDLTWLGRPFPLAPGGSEPGLWDSGLKAPLPGLATVGELLPFAYEIDVQGTGTLQFLPFGKQTTLALSSPWADPSFVGSFLPESRTVSPKGFTAAWSVPYFGRSYPQQWLASETEHAAPAAALSASAFGLSLSTGRLLPEDRARA